MKKDITSCCNVNFASSAVWSRDKSFLGMRVCFKKPGCVFAIAMLTRMEACFHRQRLAALRKSMSTSAVKINNPTIKAITVQGQS